ncbi:hypothetical protein ACFQQB_39270 [Nonomuraea rubra]|uniref:hypothetical protein n=1 Tax=Nonomuraea rubra TaxID=46180 RepID=UPI0031E5742B
MGADGSMPGARAAVSRPRPLRAAPADRQVRTPSRRRRTRWSAGRAPAAWQAIQMASRVSPEDCLACSAA